MAHRPARVGQRRRRLKSRGRVSRTSIDARERTSLYIRADVHRLSLKLNDEEGDSIWTVTSVGYGLSIDRECLEERQLRRVGEG